MKALKRATTAALALAFIGCGGVAPPAGTVPGDPVDTYAYDTSLDTPSVADPGPASDDGATPDPGAPDPGPPDIGPSDPGTVVQQDIGTIDTQGEEDVPYVMGPITWIRILDDPENSTVQKCLPFNSPGADLDAVELWRDGALVGSATKVVGDLNKDVAQKGAPCQNDFQDVEAALGPPDATANTGSVSLNGGQILLQVAGGETIIPGDVIKVYEASAGTVGMPESYFVAVGDTGEVDGVWIALGESLVGDGEVTVVSLP